jgi:hypothetical protein
VLNFLAQIPYFVTGDRRTLLVINYYLVRVHGPVIIFGLVNEFQERPATRSCTTFLVFNSCYLEHLLVVRASFLA